MRRKASAAASRVDLLLRPAVGCLVTLNIGYCAGLLFQRNQLLYSVFFAVPLFARQFLFGGAAGSALGGWYQDVLPHGISPQARARAHAQRMVVDALETAFVVGTVLACI